MNILPDGGSLCYSSKLWDNQGSRDLDLPTKGAEQLIKQESDKQVSLLGQSMLQGLDPIIHLFPLFPSLKNSKYLWTTTWAFLKGSLIVGEGLSLFLFHVPKEKWADHKRMYPMGAPAQERSREEWMPV